MALNGFIQRLFCADRGGGRFGPEYSSKEKKRLCQQIKEILEKIQNDARFLADYQKALEKKLLNSIRQL